MVTLAEDLFLLAHDDETGRKLIAGTSLDLGLGGALLLDLALRDRVTLVDSQVALVDRTPVGEPLLDAALTAVAGDERRHEPEHWVRHLARGVRSAVQQRLASAGVLRVEDHKVLGVLPIHHARLADPGIERRLVHDLYDAVVLGAAASRETAALASLALAVELERHLFPRSDRRAVQRRMGEIAEGAWVGAAVHHAIDAVNAALGIAAVPATVSELTD